MNMTLDNPLLESLGVELLEWQLDTCTLGLDIQPHHLNRQRSLHGGVIATLLDAACGYAGIYSPSGEVSRHAVTVMLNISYIGMVQGGRVKVTGRVTGSGRKIYFAAAELRRESGELVATAQGSFKRSATSGNQ
jgi:uncharacterized protein (TIGR00369 family)